MYSIGNVAEQVGITAATLRAWERRYSVVHPQRTDGDYRIYTADDVQLLRSMKQLIDAGWSPSFAAREALRRQGDKPREDPPDDNDLAEQFVAAAASLDAPGLDRLLDQMFSLASFETVLESYLFPALRALGDAWAAGQATVAGEHLASYAVGRRLSNAYDAAARTHNGPRVLVGLGPGSRHELGLLAFAVSARRRGITADYLGADVPAADWLTAASDPAVAAIVLGLPTEADVAATSEVIDNLQRRHPHLVIAAGGAKEKSAPAGVVRLGGDLLVAAQTLAELISSAPSQRQRALPTTNDSTT